MAGKPKGFWQRLAARLERGNARAQRVLDPLAAMTMYSSDPQLSRTSTIHTAQQELEKFKQAQAQQQAVALAQHGEDLAREDERMRILGRVIADEIVRRVEQHAGRVGGETRV